MGNLERYTELLQEVEEAKQAHARARGAYEQTMRKAKEAHGITSLKEAKARAAKLAAEAKKKEEAFNAALGEFEERWAEAQEVAGEDE